MTPNQDIPPRGSERMPEYTPRLVLSPEIITLASSSKAGEIDTYGATPLDQMITLAQQEEARINLQALTYRASELIPMQIVSYIHDTFSTRFINRSLANYENYTSRLVDDYQDFDDAKLIIMVERARLGSASPAELMIVRDILGIRSVELACLTHPYGENIGMLDTMRSEVSAAAKLLGGEMYDEPETHYRVKEIIGEDDPSLLIDGKPPGILMTRKRTLGTLPDGSIIRERSSFVLRTDTESELFKMLGPEVIEQLIAIKNLPRDEQEHALAPFMRIIDELLEQDNHDDEAIPVSSTIYAFNKATAEQIALNDEYRKEITGQHLDEMEAELNAPTDVARKQELSKRIAEITASHQKFSGAANISPLTREFLDTLEGTDPKTSVRKNPFSKLFKRN